jgi:glycerol-3-phosphate acyltransferase PlsX
MAKRIVLDAMGGDHAPEVPVTGAISALAELGGDFELVLVGDEARIRTLLHGREYPSERLHIHHAPESIGMDEAPMAALRRKRRSSIQLGLELQAAGEADAFVSAGHTGVVMAASLTTLGRIEGIPRPAIVTIFPTQELPCIVLDVGANVDPRPDHMVQFAIMGHVCAREVLGRERPRVGLLSIGKEAGKGNDLTVTVHDLLLESGLDFIGNVEGRDVLSGAADVVVTDGFTGNVVLKFAESFLDFLTDAVSDEIQRRPLARLGAILMTPALRSVKRRIDYSEYGGAPLLGVDGVVIIAHGGSDPKAVRNAIRVALRAADRELHHRIARAVSAWTGDAVPVSRSGNQVLGGPP